MKIKLCSIAWFVLFFSVVGIILDYYIFGSTLLGFLVNVIFAIFFVMLANWACYKEGYNWLAWFIVIIAGLGILIGIYMLKKKDTNQDIYQVLLEEKKFRDKYGL